MMDGMLNFYNVIGEPNDFLMTLNYILAAFFSMKFANSYLFLDNYFPKLKKYSIVIIGISIVFGILYLVLKNYHYLLILNVLVFSLLLAYWISAVLLFNKNVYTKILAFAYVIILFSAIDFFILKYLGISFVEIDALSIKIGSFLEMIILSVAVLYRMKILQEENIYMRSEIVNYSEQLNNIYSKNKVVNKNKMDDLSLREKEIFDLIVLGNTNKEIANDLIISVNTVKFHVKNIYDKLNIKSRREAKNLTTSP